MTYQMRPSHLIHCLCVVQLDVEVLIHALQCPTDLDLILEFDGDFVLDECFEETNARSLAKAHYAIRHSLVTRQYGPEKEHSGWKFLGRG